MSALTLSLSPDDEAARDVALQWLQLVDSGKYKDAALQTVEQVRVLPHWLSYFAARRAPLGAVKNRQIVEVKHAQSVRGAAEYAEIRHHPIEDVVSKAQGAAATAAATAEH